MKKTFLAAAFGLLGLTSAALSQVTLPIAPQVNTGDLFQVIPRGQPSAGNVYVLAPQISGIEGYSYVVPVTAFALTPGNAVMYLYLNPAGTLATGAVTLPPAPGDGQRFCLSSTQTQTAITISANTGQSLGGIAAPTALVATTRYCWFWNAPLSTWLRYV
jgi:hypothetical protein